MKTLKLMMVMTVMLLATVSVHAQNADASAGDTPMEKFFIGSWKLNVYGLPSGDGVMLLIIEKKDGKLQGTLGGEHNENPNPLTKVVIDKNTLNVNFIGQGYNVPMYLDKKGDNKVSGSMNDMFDVDGTKVVPASK